MASKISAYLSFLDDSYCIHDRASSVRLNPQFLSSYVNDHQNYVALTVIHWDENDFDDDDLEDVCQRYQSQDDVWCRDFLSVIVLLHPSAKSININTANTTQVDGTTRFLKPGPYVAAGTGHIFPVSKLVPDTYHAFVCGLIGGQKSNSAFREIPLVRGVPVPSKLYSHGDKRPLAGLRFAMKDAIACRGTKTGFGNKSWLELAEVEKSSAPCLRLLLDAGAVLVGKVKLTEFAEGLDPCEWTDICPYNPRGDGLQKPSSSSAGSAVAAAAYNWLDFTVGTDTGGSIRHPAGINGLYGQRPTHGLIDLKGVLGATDLFNTVGIFARNVDIFCRVGGQFVHPTKHVHIRTLPQKFNLLYPTRAPLGSKSSNYRYHPRWFPHPSEDIGDQSEADKHMEAMIVNMEAQLGCERIPFDINALWRATPPKGLPRSLDKAIGHIYSVLTTAIPVQTTIDPFATKYATANQGKLPQITPLVQRRLEYGRKVSEKQITNALAAMESFHSWIENTFFSSFDQDATTLLIFPQSWGIPDYRDDVPDRSVLFNNAFSIYSFGYLVGCPDYTIPVGEVPYMSKATNRIEHLPVSISMIGRRGTDLELFSVLDHLHKAGVIPDVTTGSRLFMEDEKS